MKYTTIYAAGLITVRQSVLAVVRSVQSTVYIKAETINSMNKLKAISVNEQNKISSLIRKSDKNLETRKFKVVKIYFDA